MAMITLQTKNRGRRKIKRLLSHVPKCLTRKDGRSEHTARTKRESAKKRTEVTDLLVLHRIPKSLKNVAGFSRK